MKTSRTYVFVFVPIPKEWGANGFRDSNSTARRKNGSVLLPIQLRRTRDAKFPIVRTRSLEREADALPHHLFWTWFVDNPRPSCS
jgi:hypothetical protein